MSHPTTAKHDGTCPLCDSDIEAGYDDVVYDDVLQAWVHAECAEDADDDDWDDDDH